MKIEIHNCNFTYQCPLDWDALLRTEHEDVRFCTECQQQVYFCATSEKLYEAISLNRCVAIEDEEGLPLMGYISA